MSRHTGMWIADDAFLERLRTDHDSCVTTVTVERDQPYYDIDVVSDLGITGPQLPDFADRFKRLRRRGRGPAGGMLVSCGDLSGSPAATDEDAWVGGLEQLTSFAPRVLVVPGNGDAARATSGARFYRRIGMDLPENAPVAQACAAPVVSVVRVCTSSPEPAPPLAYVAVIGFDSNEAAYRNPLVDDHGQVAEAQLGAADRLVQALTRTIAENTPLYVIAVTHHNLLPVADRIITGSTDQLGARAGSLECQGDGSPGVLATLCTTRYEVAESSAGGTTNSSGFLAFCRRARISMVLHADMGRRELLTVSSTPLVPGESRSEISVVACPSFGQARHAAGMARLRLNAWKGEAEVAYWYDDGMDAGDAPVQIVRTLVSASRVTPAERRLYESVRELLATAPPAATEPGRPSPAGFRAQVEQTWSDTGYVPLCLPDGTLPPLPQGRTAVYHLLLLLRERPAGNRGPGPPSSRFDILLSHHTPLRPPQLADWDTLLLPAFRDVRSLLEHLRDDVLRQVLDQAEDLEMARTVRDFEDAVGRILSDPGKIDDDVWADELREIDSVTKFKISPTNGCVTAYEYHLVTLLPFVRSPDSELETGPSTPDGAPDAGAKRQRHEDYSKIAAWLDLLPAVRRAGDHDGAARVIPLAALQPDGAGLRWDPRAAGHSDGRARRLPPGAVWFPLAEPGAEPGDSPWLQCPSIVARNADVMYWVESRLRTLWENGRYPPEILQGQLVSTAATFTVESPQYPFSPRPGGPQPSGEVPARCTEEALAKVEYVAGFDLEGQRPYEGLELLRIYLARREIQVNGRNRPVILVFDAQRYDEAAARRAHPRGALGTLRPVQRYVLRAGLQRARELHDRVLSQLEDPWGFVRIHKMSSTRAVSLTPPILELLHEDDWENDRGESEYVLCDGNHRVVELVWNGGQVLPAVAVNSEPRQPYYAYPFSRFEWGITAANEQNKSPDQASKYAVRAVDLDALSPQARTTMQRWPASLRYRRYYRDLTKGFGYLGGQGGRYV